MSAFALELHSFYEIDCYRGGSLLWQDSFWNLVTTVGKNKVLDATFRTGEAALAWYVGLVNDAAFTAFSVTDTMASHAGWAESAGYGEATRQAYVPAAAALGSMSNDSARAFFTINANATLHGAFLVDDSTKSGGTGTLYGEGAFAFPHVVVIGDIVSVKITLTAA